MHASAKSSKVKAEAKTVWQLTKDTISQFLEDRGPRLGAAFSYYAIFSIGPLLIIALFLIGLIYGQKAASDQLRPQLVGFVGDKAAEFVQGLVTHISKSAHLSLTGIISIALIIYAATNLFIALQDSLNTIFNVQPKSGRGIKGILKDRFLSFITVFLVGAFVIASIILTTVIAAAAKLFPLGNPVITTVLLQIINFFVSAAVFTGVFALMFKYLPDIKISWRDTFIGAAATAVLFSLARIGLAFYLGYSSTASPFGAAGSLVVIMLFIYYSSQIFFLGAQFTQVYSCRAGDPIVPSDNAILLPCKARQGAGSGESNCTRPKSEAHDEQKLSPKLPFDGARAKPTSRPIPLEIPAPHRTNIERIYPTHTPPRPTLRIQSPPPPPSRWSTTAPILATLATVPIAALLLGRRHPRRMR